MNSSVQNCENQTGHKIRILSYNVQVGIEAAGYSDYLLHGWKHILPFKHRMLNLYRISRLIQAYDVVGLQELDSGSLRSSFINCTEYLAREACFPHWYDKTNRSFWKVARNSMGLLCKLAPFAVSRHDLPGLVPGRGALVVHFGNQDDPLIIVLVHLALSRAARLFQVEYLSNLIKGYNHVIIMGDMNCSADSRELKVLMEETRLTMPYSNLYTYPSWNPRRNIDHILISPSIVIDSVQVLNYPLSDHLPISMEITPPECVFATRKDVPGKNRAA